MIWSHSDGEFLDKGLTSPRGRIELGFDYRVDENININSSSYFDGIGASNNTNYGLSLGAKFKF